MTGEGAKGRAEGFARTWFRCLWVWFLVAGALFVPLFVQADTRVQRVVTGAAVGGHFLTAAAFWFARRDASGRTAKRDRPEEDAKP